MPLFTRKRHFPVGVTDTPTGQPRRSWVDIACVVFFLICVGVWLVCIPFIAECILGISRGNADGLGMGLFSAFIVLVSMPPLAVAFTLSVLASRLPTWFRVLSVLPGLAGVLTGVGMFLALGLSGAK